MLKTNAPKKKKKSIWDQAVNIFGILSEAANIGIVIEIVAKWWPALLTIGRGIFSLIPFYSDPIIYFFKSLSRLTRIIGRNFFGITFEEEKNGAHPWQTAGDILSLTFFTLAIPMFLGAIVTGPVGITLAWSLALCGLMVVGFFDYRYQAKMAQEKYEKADAAFLAQKTLSEQENSPELQAQHEHSLNACEKEKNVQYEEYRTKRNSYYLYMGLLLGLGCLLIFGSAALFAPPALVPIFVIISKVASGYLGLIAVGRLFNWITSSKKETPECENTVTASLEAEQAPDSPYDSTATALSLLKAEPKTEQTVLKAPVQSQLFGKSSRHETVGLECAFEESPLNCLA